MRASSSARQASSKANSANNGPTHERHERQVLLRNLTDSTHVSISAMSQGSGAGHGSPSGRSSPAPSSSSSRVPRNPSYPIPFRRPQYMTVGSGSTSASAAALMASLDNDSGYGGSISGDGDSYTNDGSTRGWNLGHTSDMPIPPHTPTVPGEFNPAADNERRIIASHVHQLYYNQNRVALGRSINRTIETLKDLQQMNSDWPAQYPSVRAQEPSPTTADPRPGLAHTQSSREEFSPQKDNVPLRPFPLRRAATTLGESVLAESSTAVERAATSEPVRLITPQAAQEFLILKLDLKAQGLTQSEIANSLEKRTIASLLDGKINKSIKHLLSLRDRIEDTSSKVLVTGDLNAGKSTFCNALLRRKVLPEDQQPCTSIFCEVLDARENAGIEEVHAVHKDIPYERNDESTYDVYSLQELEKIVTDNDQYTQCKVYVKDIRTIDESLLNNGVVDISIIDAPGLNSDSLKTTAVFARQEEIDVVVFVVNAANHFTLSAKEFIWNAACEKAYIFIVVNGFDNIRDKERCQRRVLEQVASLSPRTFKESSELVHFVSSNAIPVAPPPSGPNGGAGNSSDPSSDNPLPSEDDDEPIGKHGSPGSPPSKGKGKELAKLRDFEQLEGALRRFVLEKRARSKLAPAKTYLLNMLSDLHHLGVVNRDIAQSELDRVSRELSDLKPIYESSKKACAEVSDDVDKTTEETCSEVYTHTRTTLSTTIARVADTDLGVTYPGLLSAFQYAEDIKTAMLDQISASVTNCEDYARARTVGGVNAIKSLGILHLGDEYNPLTFQPDMMFRRKRDALARQVDTSVELWDFFDLTGLWERQEKVAGTGMALSIAGLVGGRMLGGVGWVDGAVGAMRVMGTKNMRKLVLPGIVATVILTTTLLLSRIPTSLPPLLSRRIATTLSALDYTHLNASRISAEVRKCLKYPASDLNIALSKKFEDVKGKREEAAKVMQESEVARKFFGNLVRESEMGRGRVEAVDLEGAPGVAGGVESGVLV